MVLSQVLQRLKWLLLFSAWCAPGCRGSTIGRIPNWPSSRMLAEAGLPATDDSGPRELDRSEEGEWPDRSGKGEGESTSSITELNFLSSEGFACFIDALVSETQTNYSDLAVVVDFIANNGASEEMLGRRYFVLSKPLWAAAVGSLAKRCPR